MARKSRKNYYSEFFHIMVQGINKEFIFKAKEEKEKYLKILKENCEKCENDTKIIAYCMMDNHAHILFHSDKTKDITKIMSKTNTKYAIYYNKKNDRCGYVFRDRYRAEEIIDAVYLISCIRYIHNNPIKALICYNKNEYLYSSYLEYEGKKQYFLIDICYVKALFDLLGIDYQLIFKDTNENVNFIECDKEKNKAKEIIEIVNEFITDNGIGLEQLKVNTRLYREIIKKLYFEYEFKQKEIAEYFAVSTSKISRVCNEGAIFKSH